MISSAGGAVSAEWAPRLIDAGAVVVDNTSYWRMHDDVPLVVPEVNPDAADGHRGLIANPNCSTMQMVVALKPILARPGSSGSSSRPTSRSRAPGARDRGAARAVARGARRRRRRWPRSIPHPIAFNVLPQVETFKDGDDYTTEERKMMAETRKILGAPRRSSGSRRPAPGCRSSPRHSESVNVQTREPLAPEECRELLAAAPGVVVLDDPARASTRCRPRSPAATRSSSAGSAATPRTSAA